jgi:hypothetical protein
MEDIVQAVHSFQQLAVLDPVTAGEIWMEGETASDWTRFVERSVDDRLDASVLFGHMIPFASADDTGAYAGLYSPWVGMLLLLDYDPLATVVEAYSIHPAMRLPSDVDDPEAFALAAMAAIDSASAQFDAAAGGEGLPAEMSARDVEGVVDAVRPQLASAYGLIESPSIAQANVETAMDLVFADELAFPLDLLNEIPSIWRNMLLPVWIAEARVATFIVLASPTSPLDWVWLEVSADQVEPLILSVSLMKLYDSLTTRGGEDS